MKPYRKEPQTAPTGTNPRRGTIRRESMRRLAAALAFAVLGGLAMSLSAGPTGMETSTSMVPCIWGVPVESLVGARYPSPPTVAGEPVCVPETIGGNAVMSGDYDANNWIKNLKFRGSFL